MLIVPENQPHKAFLPGPEEEQPQQRTPVATVTRRAEWAKQHKKEKNKREAREGMPTKALFKVYRGHISPITCIDHGLLGHREFFFSGSMDATARMYNVATAECLHVFEGHAGPVTALKYQGLKGYGSIVRESRVIEQTLAPTWGDFDQDRWVFKLDSMYKNVCFRVYDWDAVGQHDYMGQVSINLRDDILQGKEAKNPTLKKWFPLARMGNAKGKLHVQFGWDDKAMELTVFLLEAKDLPRMDGVLLKSDPYVIIKVEDQLLPRLFTGSEDKTIKMWSIDTGMVLQNFIGHARSVTSVMISNCFNETVLISSSIDKTVRMWNVKDGGCMRIFEHAASVNNCSLEIIPEKGLKRQVHEEQITLPSEVLIHVNLDFDVAANTKLLTVTVVKAKNLPIMDGDFSTGGCDPYVIVSVGHESQKGQVQKKTLNPLWNEVFEFDDFSFTDEVIIRLYDWDLMSDHDYIGHISILLEPLKMKRKVKEWFPVDHEPFGMIRLFSACADNKLRMMDVLSGKVLNTFVGHKGPVTEVHLCQLQDEDVHLFSCSLDKTIKLWDLNPETGTVSSENGNSKDASEHETKPVKSWQYPTAIYGFFPAVIEENLRLFAACQDANVYMRTMDLSVIIAKGNWRQGVAKIMDSITFSVTILCFIVLDITVGLYYDTSINSSAPEDCYQRESLVPGIVTTFVLWVFSQEVFASLIIRGRHLFVPMSWQKMWNYLDIAIVAISVGVSAYKVAMDYSQEGGADKKLWLKDGQETYIPAPLTSDSLQGMLLCPDEASASTGKETQKAATGFRAARVLGRIATGVRILRGLIKAARIAQRLGGKRGKKFEGHDRAVVALKIIPPAQKKQDMSLFALGTSMMKPSHIKELEAWRRTYEGNWRILTGSVDCTLIMWDVLGTTIRVDNTSHFVDTEVDQMPIAELAV